MVGALVGIIATVLIALLAPVAKPVIESWLSLATASIREVRWVTEHESEGERGLLTLVDAVLVGLSDVPCEIAVYFYFAGGQPLQDTNGQYRSYDNCVSVGQTIVPTKQEEVLHNFALFVPYNELHLSPGSWNLEIIINVIRISTGKRLAKMGPVGWTYIQL